MNFTKSIEELVFILTWEGKFTTKLGRPSNVCIDFQESPKWNARQSKPISGK